MAFVKRIRKELESWAALGEREPGRRVACIVGPWASERDFWTVEVRDGDYSKLFATVRPGAGAFRGLSWTIQLEIPIEYPFKPPRIVAASVGPSPTGKFFHPFMSATGGGICGCGLADTWCAANSFVRALAFYRVAVESLDLAPQKLVPAGSDKLMCFCTLNPKAEVILGRDAAMFQAMVRLAAHGCSTIPLTVSVEAHEEHQEGPPTGDLRLTFTTMAGNVVGCFEHFSMDSRLGHLCHRLFEEIPSPDPAFRWSLVLPDDEIASESNIDLPVATALGIASGS